MLDADESQVFFPLDKKRKPEFSYILGTLLEVVNNVCVAGGTTLINFLSYQWLSLIQAFLDEFSSERRVADLPENRGFFRIFLEMWLFFLVFEQFCMILDKKFIST